MAWPTLVVELGLTTSTTSLILGNDPRGKLDTGTLDAVTWTDVTSSVVEAAGVSINRGSTRNQGPYFRYEAGSCQFKLLNRNGAWDPTNTSGPYSAGGVTLLKPGVPVRVSATYGTATFVLFVGRAESWQVDYMEAGTHSTTTVTASDPIATLVAADPLEQGQQGTGENAGARINRVLDNVGWPAADRDVDTSGLATFQATTLAQAAWTEATLVSDSVNGYLAADSLGRVVYREKNRLPRSSTMTFDDTGANLPLVDVQTSYDADQLYNLAKLARTGSTEQSASDVTSQSQYGLSTFSRSDLVVQNDDQVQDAANYIVSQYAQLTTRIESVRSVAHAGSSDAVWLQLLDLDVLDRATVSFQTPDGRTVSRDGLIRGIGLSVRANDWRWAVSFSQAPNPLGNFTLDSPTLGVLDQNTLAAF
ncbi:MAG: hypothetical protein ACKO04_04000 [Actinomycetes bacterium]